MGNIIAIDYNYRDEVNEILKREWSCPPVISKGNVIDTTVLPGFVFIEEDRIKGVITYQIVDCECEIVTLNSFDENRGIGTRLIEIVKDVAITNNCTRIWLITSNDDINAIRFYQLKGFDWVATYINAMEKSRELKPAIPLIGMNNIPIKHEIEFEIKLKERY